MSPALISVRDLHKTYGSGAGEFHALRGIDLDIHTGESLAIVGKSGSGKSTLMHLLALLDRPTSGSITLHGTETSGSGRASSTGRATPSSGSCSSSSSSTRRTRCSTT